MREVTDPAILDKLNGITASQTGLKEVTDPDVLAKLNAGLPESSQKGWDAITGPISEFIAGEKQRGADLANNMQATNAGEQSIPESMAQFALHNVVGGAAQVPVAGAEMAAKALYQSAPEPIQNALSATGNAIAQSPVGKEVGDLANQYQQNLEAFNKENPRAGRNLQAVREGVNLLPFSPEVRSAAEAGGEVAGQALKQVGEAAGKGLEKSGSIIAKTAEAVKPETMLTSDAVKQMASQAYKTADEVGGTLSPQFANKFFDTIEAMKPQTEHGIATVGENALAKLTDDWKTLRDKPISLQAAQEMDEGLSQRIDGHVDRITGKLDKEGKQLYEAQTQFRNMIDKASPNEIVGGKDGFDALNQGRAYWSTAMRIGDMERILTRATMTDNPATSIKAGFRTLYNNPSRMIGYSAPERAAIKRAAQSGIISGTLRTVLGSRLIGTTLGAGMGATAGPLGVIAGGAAGAAQSAASRAIATAMQRQRANKVIKTLSRRVKNG